MFDRAMPDYMTPAAGATPRRLLTEEERRQDRLNLLRDILAATEAPVGTIEGDRCRARIRLCCELLMRSPVEIEERTALGKIEVAASSLYSKPRALEPLREALRRQIRECCKQLAAAWGENRNPPQEPR